MMGPRILLVDDNDNVRTSLAQVLQLNNFDVVTAAGVKEALSCISAQTFDVLLCDLHMPGRGDGFTVVSAMRHSYPEAVTLVFSGYPELKEAMSAILMQADEVLVKPLNIPKLVELIREKLLHRKTEVPRATETVATILEHDCTATIQDWLARVDRHQELAHVPLDYEQRTGHLPHLFGELVVRLRQPQNLDGKRKNSQAAAEHGRIRRRQGYTADMMVEESRMLQVSIFQTLQNNLHRVDFSLLLVDVMTIADEVDWQLTQAMRSYMGQVVGEAAA